MARRPFPLKYFKIILVRVCFPKHYPTLSLITTTKIQHIAFYSITILTFYLDPTVKIAFVEAYSGFYCHDLVYVKGEKHLNVKFCDKWYLG